MSEFAQKVNDENRDLYAYLSEHTGLHVTDFELASDLFDTLSIQVEYYHDFLISILIDSQT